MKQWGLQTSSFQTAIYILHLFSSSLIPSFRYLQTARKVYNKGENTGKSNEG